MRLKRVDKPVGKSILVMILDSYQEYCSLNYPKDPKVYFIRANPETARKLALQFSNSALLKEKCPECWGFNLVEDVRLLPHEIVFGPEQTTIFWSDN